MHSDAQLVDDGDGVGGPVSARARMVTLPYWFIVVLGVPMPLLWLRVTRRRGYTPCEEGRRQHAEPTSVTTHCKALSCG